MLKTSFWRTKMKRFLLQISVILTLVCFFGMNGVYADEYSVFGGIKREESAKKEGTFVYEEMCFMSGSPVLLRGTVSIPKKPDSDSYTTTLKYSLSSEDDTIKLERSMSIDVNSKKNNESDQVITNWTIKSGGIKETVTIGEDTYNLSSYKFDNSTSSDLKAVGNFMLGSLHFEKIFTTGPLDSNEGKKITIIGDSVTYVSYETIWSSAETMVVDEKISFVDSPTFHIEKEIGPLDYKEEKKNTNGWQGTVRYSVSNQSQSKFDYVKNTVKNTSFRKGLLKSTNNEYNIGYEYNLPGDSSAETNEKSEEEADDIENPENESGDGNLDSNEEGKNNARNKGRVSLDSYNYERSTMLPIPKYNDVGNHWAEENIFKMASLGAFDLDKSFFPDEYITRAAFARAILNAIDSVEPEDEKVRIAEFIKSKRPNAKKALFEDVRRDSKDYIFVKEANERKLMLGEGNRQFLPNRPLTREEAITILIRAFGMDDTAPSLPFTTRFRDDSIISPWAKTSIYQAVDLGIISGYEDGTIKPKKRMTRAEVSHMLVKYIEHLRKEIPKDYKQYLREEY